MKNKSIFGKKQLIMAALLLALGGAVWLNMQYSGAAGGFITNGGASSNKNLGDTKYVANVSGETAVQTAAGTDYFTTANAERKKARDEAIALLEETLSKVDSNSSAKQKASDEITDIAKRIEQEAAIETLIKAKGFETALVVIGDDSVSVIVKADELLQSQILQIQDAVTSQTKISLENIKIVNKK